MSTLHLKYSLFFSSESICHAVKNKNVYLLFVVKVNTCNCKTLWNARSKIPKQISNARRAEVVVGSGRKIAIGEQKEKQLADCIKTMCNVGFSPSLRKIKQIVREYVESNKLKTPFKNNRSGKKCVKSFKKRNRMSLKKANMISSARKSTTSNPFIVFGFYDTLKELCQKNNFFPRKYGM